MEKPDSPQGLGVVFLITNRLAYHCLIYAPPTEGVHNKDVQKMQALYLLLQFASWAAGKLVWHSNMLGLPQLYS